MFVPERFCCCYIFGAGTASTATCPLDNINTTGGAVKTQGPSKLRMIYPWRCFCSPFCRFASFLSLPADEILGWWKKPTKNNWIQQNFQKILTNCLKTEMLKKSAQKTIDRFWAFGVLLPPQWHSYIGFFQWAQNVAPILGFLSFRMILATPWRQETLIDTWPQETQIHESYWKLCTISYSVVYTLRWVPTHHPLCFWRYNTHHMPSP